MTSPDQAGPKRPARLAGLALLAVAAVALVGGLISLFSGGGSNPGSNNAAGSTSATPSSQPTSQASSPTPPSSAAPPPSTSSSSQEPPSSPPSSSSELSTSTEAPPPPPPAGTPKNTQPIRVYNNSFIQGLAARAATDFRDGGWAIESIAGYKGKIPVTTVYYRPGTAEESEAKALASQFGLHVDERFDGIKDATPGIIVIVTKDYVAKN